MRYIIPAIVTIPTILILAVVAYGMLNGRYLFQELGIPSLVGLFPILSFTTSIALIFVFPNAREWKMAALINAIPLVLVGLALLFFALIGYHG
jgi:hypothetical protein